MSSGYDVIIGGSPGRALRRRTRRGRSERRTRRARGTAYWICGFPLEWDWGGPQEENSSRELRLKISVRKWPIGEQLIINGGNKMPDKSSHPLLSYTDSIAAGMTDTWLLIGRILVALLFLLTVWFGSPSTAYLTSINYVMPEVWSIVARVVEWIIVISLVLGLGTRYGALLGFLFVVIATVTAHRWWGYPQAAQLMNYTFLVKNLAALGGLLLLFATGAGRFSVDNMLADKSRTLTVRR